MTDAATGEPAGSPDDPEYWGIRDEPWPVGRVMRNPELAPGWRNYVTWLRGGNLRGGCTPTDIDAVLHDRVHDRALHIEFKPHGRWSGGLLSTGQVETLSHYPRHGDLSLLIEEPEGSRSLLAVGARWPLGTAVHYSPVPSHPHFAWRYDLEMPVGRLHVVLRAFMRGETPAELDWERYYPERRT